MSTPQLPAPDPQPVLSSRDALIATPHEPRRVDVAAWVLMGLALAYVLNMHLLPAMLGGLLAFELVHGLAPRITGRRLSGSRARIVVVALLATVVVGLLGLAVLGLIAYARNGVNVPGLFHKMAEIIEAHRTTAPAWLLEYLPENAEEIRRGSVSWLRAHAGDLQIIGTEAGRTVVHILIGMIIGAMVALQEVVPGKTLRPLAASLKTRVGLLASAFRRVVFAQVRIAALNTFFTWLYLGVALPLLFGVELPFLKTLIVVTFVCGLLPVLGNLISNTVIVVVSLNHSPGIAVASLSYLVIIHKLEYFLNARIIGTQIRTKAWEILLAMLAMEVAFGIPGVIAAPIFYAYLKDELTQRALI